MSLPLTRKDLMIVNMGPQHPSMHGVLRLIVTLDGEDVIDCEPILGYLHRGMEKIAERGGRYKDCRRGWEGGRDKIII
jgi:NADH:ubiquinone oxidoreductase subunit D